MKVAGLSIFCLSFLLTISLASGNQESDVTQYSRKLFHQHCATSTATAHLLPVLQHFNRRLQQKQSTSLAILLSGQETAAAIANAARGGANMMQVVAVGADGNKLARQVADQSLSTGTKTGAFDLSRKPPEKEPGRLRRP